MVSLVLDDVLFLSDVCQLCHYDLLQLQYANWLLGIDDVGPVTLTDETCYARQGCDTSTSWLGFP